MAMISCFMRTFENSMHLSTWLEVPRATSRGSVRFTSMRRRVVVLSALLIALAVIVYAGAPYARATMFIVRAAGLGGRAEAFADREARTVAVQPRYQVTTRYGDVPAQLYVPDGTSRRTVLLVPGEPENIKITTAADLAFARGLLRERGEA